MDLKEMDLKEIDNKKEPCGSFMLRAVQAAVGSLSPAGLGQQQRSAPRCIECARLETTLYRMWLLALRED